MDARRNQKLFERLNLFLRPRLPACLRFGGWDLLNTHSAELSLETKAKSKVVPRRAVSRQIHSSEVHGRRNCGVSANWWCTLLYKIPKSFCRYGTVKSTYSSRSRVMVMSPTAISASWKWENKTAPIKVFGCNSVSVWALFLLLIQTPPSTC